MNYLLKRLHSKLTEKGLQFQKELIKGMKILLYNPNTSESITEKLYETAKLVVSSETT